VVGKPEVITQARIEFCFMTLRQATHGQSLLASLFANPANGARHDKATLAVCEKAAEQGLPTAQLALAQLYAARRAGPKDLVHAYMWFLVASEQITQAKNHVNQSMTMEHCSKPNNAPRSG
jgi:TPR repeat protein